ncbi:MAG: hypothetical protein WA432_03590 [Candidatus Babeliaceae bacterium]
MKIKTYFLATILCINYPLLYTKRSIHRPQYISMKRIQVSWEDDPDSMYELVDNHFEEYALFHKFDADFFQEHLLPTDTISYRYESDKHIEGTVLSELIESFVKELTNLSARRKTFKHFIILKMSDFNFRTASGIIVVKFKNYPFVVKLFMENPQSFVKPDSKGFEQYCFFIMGGGINRYLAGFTRIKNLEGVREYVKNDPYWSTFVDFPRKWFWEPNNNRFFRLTGININGKPSQSIVLPSIYAIVCDEIIMDRPFSLFKKTDRKRAIELSYFLNLRIDPHINNFMIEKDTKKIVIIDTEHFPSIVGVRKPITFKSYFSWYRQMAWRFTREKYGKLKKTRLSIKQESDLGLLKF